MRSTRSGTTKSEKATLYVAALTGRSVNASRINSTTVPNGRLTSPRGREFDTRYGHGACGKSGYRPRERELKFATKSRQPPGSCREPRNLRATGLECVEICAAEPSSGRLVTIVPLSRTAPPAELANPPAAPSW
jgi:hypothetical protein